MWSIPSTREVAAHIAATAELMRDVSEFKRAMRRALNEWPKSCAVAMTTPGLNKRAWLGHAGCYLATGSPEETTRLGWHDLDDDQQRAANAAADSVASEWHRLNAHAQQAADDQMGLFDA
jgi:glutaminase